MKRLAAIAVLALVVLTGCTDDAKECAKHGGTWQQVGQHYDPPVYIHTGGGVGTTGVMIPVTGGEVADYDCVGAR